MNEHNACWKALDEKNEIVIHVKNLTTGRSYRMDCHAFMVESRMIPFETTSYHDKFRQFGPLTEPELTFRVSGPVKMVEE